jgi:hypothetical protein
MARRWAVVAVAGGADVVVHPVFVIVVHDDVTP